MTRIPREFIQQLLAKIEIVDFIDARVPLQKKSSNNYFACCPFHNENSPSFSVSQNKQFYYCFGCGAHGNAIDFLMQYDKLPFLDAVETLARQAGLEIPRESQAQVKTVTPALYDLLTHITQYYQNELRQSEAAIAYLKKRAITGHIAKEFKLGFAPNGWDNVLQRFGGKEAQNQLLLDAGMLIKKDKGGFYDRFRERIMFPIEDPRGRVVGFGGRVLNHGEPKYLNSPETVIFQKGHELYGLNHVLKAEHSLKRILIVEGYMDVIALFQHGITYAVATLGTATTAHHLKRLARYTNDLIFCFDGDTAGRTAAWRALQVLFPLMRDDFQIKFMFLPENEDPDSLIQKEGKESFEKRIQDALPLSHFFFQTIAKEIDMNNMDGRSLFVTRATDLIKQLPPGIFQQMMLDELGRRARVNVAQLNINQKAPLPPQNLKKSSPKTPSTLRLALTLLVQDPTLINEMSEPLPKLTAPGYALFEELISVIKHNAIQTTGMLLEHWRDQKEAKLIAKLAKNEHMIPPNGIKNEFIGTLTRLKKWGQEELIDSLLAKAAMQTLSLEERKELQELIHSKE